MDVKDERTLDDQNTLKMYEAKYKRKRNICLAAAVVLVLIFCVYMLFPMQLGRHIEDDQALTILVTNFSVENGMPLLDMTNYEVRPETAEYTELVTILSQYTYHRNLRTLIGAAGLEESQMTVAVTIYNGVHQILAINGSKYITSGKAYTLGYGGDDEAHKLLSEILEFLLQIEPVTP